MAEEDEDMKLDLETDQESDPDTESDRIDIDTDQEPENGSETDSSDSTNSFIVDTDRLTGWMEFVPIPAFTIWAFLARSYGAVATFTYNGTTLCHFDDSSEGMHFALTVASHPNLPLLVDLIEESEAQYWARIQEIKDNPPTGEFIWEESGEAPAQ